MESSELPFLSPRLMCLAVVHDRKTTKFSASVPVLSEKMHSTYLRLSDRFQLRRWDRLQEVPEARDSEVLLSPGDEAL